jgi:tetratricopeptide (TPR) repeat protein
MADSPSELHAEIEKLERKHAEHPEGRYFVPLANAYRKLGDVEYAENLLREGLRRHPDYLSAHIVLGRCLADRSATREAGDEFRYVLSFDPQNLIALRTLGELAAAEGRSEEAERWYEELLAVDPMNDEARRALESLRGAAAVPEVEEEFRPDAAWWEREPEPDPARGEELGDGPEPMREEEPVADSTVPAWPAEDAAPEALPAWNEPEEEEQPAEEDAGEAELVAEEPVEQEPDDEEAAGNVFEAADPADTAGESEPQEVVTETIAELYARQGFYERAAGVYRELIRRRGGDLALERRLAEMEAMMGHAEPVAPPPPPAPSEPEPTPESEAALEPGPAFVLGPAPGLDAAPGFESAPAPEPEPSAPPALEQDTFATSFADGFFSAETTSEAEPEEPAMPEEPRAQVPEEPGETTEPESLAEPGPAPVAAVERETIASYLRALLAWTPGEELLPQPQPAAEATLAPEAGPEEPEEARAEPETPVEPELKPEPGWSPEPASEAEPEVAEEPGTGRAEAELFPWELPMETSAGPSRPDVWEASQSATPRTEPENEPEPVGSRDEEDFFSFDAFFAEEPAAEPAPTAEARPAGEPSAPEVRPEPAAAAEEDDDLESFQAWLRSLKR